MSSQAKVVNKHEDPHKFTVSRPKRLKKDNQEEEERLREGLAKHLFDSIDGTVDFCILVEHEFYNKSESLFVNELKNICEQFNARSCIFTFDSNKNYQFTDFFNNNIDGSVQLKAVSPLNASQFPDRLFDLKWRDSSKRFVFRLENR